MGITSDENLKGCFIKDMIRAHILDIHNDLSEESCTKDSLLRIKHLRTIVETFSWELIKPIVNQDSKVDFLNALTNYYDQAILFQQKLIALD